MDNLKEYLRDVLEVEKNVYTLSQVKNRMNNYMSRLGNAQNIQQPNKRSAKEDFSSLYGLIIGGGVVGAIIGWIVAAAGEKGGTGSGLINAIVCLVKAFFSGYGWARIGIGLLIGAAIGLIILIFASIHYSSEASHENDEARQRYANAIAQDKNRVAMELNTKNQTIQFYNATCQQLADTQQTLEKLYSLNIIHPNYRNFVAVSSFYQYFDTGRCTTLEGHEGAYNLFEAERRQNMIILQLNNVIAQLEEIKYNQSMLYDAISESNRKIENLTQISQMTMDYSRSTANNSEIIAFNTEVTARNTEYLKWIAIFRNINR